MRKFFRKHYKWVVLIIAAVAIKLFSLNRNWVELYYSNGIYPGFSRSLRWLFGWLPFSIGDLLYGAMIGWIIYQLVRVVKALVRRRVTRSSFGRGFIKALLISLCIYVIFNAFWGINYNRKGIARQLDLKNDTFNLVDLQNINQLLVDKVNASKQSLVNAKAAYPDNKDLFRRVAAAYAEAEKQYPFLQYSPVSLKSSMWGWIGSYTGFTGYYNPFSGEAQVNTNVPRFLLPFTSCHEVAHQLGYAKENEANFVGFLAARASTDTMFHYSLYLDLFLYANRSLPPNIAKQYRSQLIAAVEMDLAEWKAFSARHRNPFEPVIRRGYAFYLRRNEQPKGIRSYDEVTTFIMAYYKRFGKI